MANREGFFRREDLDKLGMKKLSLIGLVIIVFIALVFLVTRPAPAPGVSAAGTINFALNPNASSISAGGVVGVQVNTSSATDLYGIDVSVAYNGSVLDYTGFSEGTFLNASGTVPTYVPDTYTTYSNNVSHLVITRLGNVSGADGSGTLMTLYFRGLAQGNSPLNLDVVASDSNGTAISINNVTNSSVSVSGAADLIAPELTFDSPVDYYNSSNQNVTFSATATDSSGNVSSVSLYGNWGGTWSSKDVVSSPANGAKTSFTVTIPEGKYVWNVYACDGSNNCDFANSNGEPSGNRSLTVDTTDPGLVINSPGNTTLTSTSVKVNISYTDNLGFGYCSYNITNTTGYQVIANNFVPCTNPHTETQVLNDSHTYILNAWDNDSAGNSNSSSVLFSIKVPAASNGGGSSSGGGGGGGSSSTTSTGGGAATNASNETSAVPVTAETHTSLAVRRSVLYFSSSTGIKQISLWFTNPTTGASVSIDRFTARPAAVPTPLNHKVYRYLRISLHNSSENFGNATTILEVQNSWLQTNGINNQNIALYEFNNQTNAWVQLDTEYNSSDEKYSYYFVNQTHFSYFAIAQKISHLYLYLGIIGGALVLVIIIIFVIREEDKRKGRQNMLQNLSKNS